MSTGSYMHDRPLVTKATQEDTTVHRKGLLSSRVEAVGRELARYGLVVVVGWIGLMKFTAYEAEGISPYVANSPLMSWVYGLHEPPRLLGRAWRGRGHDRDPHRRSAVLAAGSVVGSGPGGRRCSSRP